MRRFLSEFSAIKCRENEIAEIQHILLRRTHSGHVHLPNGLIRIDFPGFSSSSRLGLQATKGLDDFWRDGIPGRDAPGTLDAGGEQRLSFVGERAHLLKPCQKIDGRHERLSVHGTGEPEDPAEPFDEVEPEDVDRDRLDELKGQVGCGILLDVASPGPLQ